MLFPAVAHRHHSSLAAGGASLIIRHEFLCVLQRICLFIVNTANTVFGKVRTCLEGASKDCIGLNARLESACAWDCLALLLALYSLLVAPEDVLGSGHRLLCWTSVNDRLTVVEESSTVGLEVCSLDDFV